MLGHQPSLHCHCLSCEWIWIFTVTGLEVDFVISTFTQCVSHTCTGFRYWGSCGFRKLIRISWMSRIPIIRRTDLAFVLTFGFWQLKSRVWATVTSNASPYTVKSEWTDCNYFVFGSASLLYIKCAGMVRSFWLQTVLSIYRFFWHITNNLNTSSALRST